MKKLFQLKNIFYIILLWCIFTISSALIPEIRFLSTYGSSTATTESTKVGTISLYSSPVFLPSPSRVTGHSWVYIKNTTNEDFKILDYTVRPNEGISFGTTSNPSMQARGIWVNLEGNNSLYTENISITSDFYQEDLEYLETYLINHNKWILLYNCTTFARGVWNNSYAGNYYQFTSSTPIGLYFQLYLTRIAEFNKEYFILEGSSPFE